MGIFRAKNTLLRKKVVTCIIVGYIGLTPNQKSEANF